MPHKLIIMYDQEQSYGFDHALFEVRMSQTTRDFVVMFREKVYNALAALAILEFFTPLQNLYRSTQAVPNVKTPTLHKLIIGTAQTSKAA